MRINSRQFDVDRKRKQLWFNSLEKDKLEVRANFAELRLKIEEEAKLAQQETLQNLKERNQRLLQDKYNVSLSSLSSNSNHST